MPDERYEIAYREALRAITDQETALDVLQSRAITIASAAAIATGLLGLTSDGSRSLGRFGIAAIGLLFAIVVLAGIIVWPRREWRFHFRASNLHWNYIEGPNPVSGDHMRRDLALYLDRYFESNAEKIDRFGALLGLAIVFLFLDVGAVLFQVWRM